MRHRQELLSTKSEDQSFSIRWYTAERRSEKVATQQNNGQEQDLNHLRKVRREKLAELQANGQKSF